MTYTTKRRVAYYYDAEVGNYYYSQGHPMKPHRMRMTHNLLLSYGLLDKMDVFASPRATQREMTRFHSDEYISFLNNISPDTLPEFAANLCRFNVLEDCPVFDGLWEYCQIAAGGSLAGATRLNAGDSTVAINWAGGLHHAKRAEASGFCYINDCVLAILELLKIHARVLYVDIDIHHGDGVEEAFYTTDRVMTASFHKFGDYFPGTGDVGDIGISRGKYYSANFPLRDGIDDDSYREIFVPVMSRIMEWYQPGVVVLQCGADSLSGDRLGCFNLSLMGHAQCVDFFKRYDVPLLLLGGGGYTIRNVARCWAYETSRVVGETLSDELPYNENFEFYGPEFRLHIVPSNMENHNSPAELHKTKVKIFEHLRHLPHAPSPPMIDTPRNSPITLHRREEDGHTSAIATIDDDDEPDVRKRRRRAKAVVDYPGSDEEDDDQYISSLRYVKRKRKTTNFARRRFPTAVLRSTVGGLETSNEENGENSQDVHFTVSNEKQTSISEKFDSYETGTEPKTKHHSQSFSPTTGLQKGKSIKSATLSESRKQSERQGNSADLPEYLPQKQKDGINLEKVAQTQVSEELGRNSSLSTGDGTKRQIDERKKSPKVSDDTKRKKALVEPSGGSNDTKSTWPSLSANGSNNSPRTGEPATSKKHKEPSSQEHWSSGSLTLHARQGAPSDDRRQESNGTGVQDPDHIERKSTEHVCDSTPKRTPSLREYTLSRKSPTNMKTREFESSQERYDDGEPGSERTAERLKGLGREDVKDSKEEGRMPKNELDRQKKRVRDNKSTSDMKEDGQDDLEKVGSHDGALREGTLSHTVKKSEVETVQASSNEGNMTGETGEGRNSPRRARSETRREVPSEDLNGVDDAQIGSTRDDKSIVAATFNSTEDSIEWARGDRKTRKRTNNGARNDDHSEDSAKHGESERSSDSAARDRQGYPREVEEEDMTPSEGSRDDGHEPNGDANDREEEEGLPSDTPNR